MLLIFKDLECLESPNILVCDSEFWNDGQIFSFSDLYKEEKTLKTRQIYQFIEK